MGVTPVKVGDYRLNPDLVVAVRPDVEYDYYNPLRAVGAARKPTMGDVSNVRGVVRVEAVSGATFEVWQSPDLVDDVADRPANEKLFDNLVNDARRLAEERAYEVSQLLWGDDS